MPIRPKTSEYKENFKWLPSPKSATFHPSPEQAATIAGLNSAKLSLQAEPAIQRKARPIQLMTTSTTKMFDEDIVPPPDDYILLGSQEKFSRNVAYRDIAATKAKQMLTYQPRSEQSPAGKQASGASRTATTRHDPPPKVVVDTGARSKTFKVNETTQTNDHPEHYSKNSDVPRNASRIATEQATAKGKLPLSGVQLTGQPAEEAPTGEAAPRTEAADTREVAQTNRHRHSEHYGSAHESWQGKGAARKQPATSTEGNKNNSNKGYNKEAASYAADDQASSTYAFKYKAGTAQPRPAKKRKSEYQTKFEWKKPVTEAPVLAAEEVIHKSRLQAQAAPRTSGPRKESEYSRQFKSWLPYYKPVTQDDSNIRNRNAVAQLRRASSETALVPDMREPRGPAKGSPGGKQFTDTLNPQKPFFPHGKLVRWHSEYMANFKAFDQFKYESGAWIGAAPPHRLYSSYQKVNSKEAAPQSSKSWLAEVVELRKRAEEYRKRALGTHFSREHVAQLLAEQSRLWDQEGTVDSASTVSAQPSASASSAGSRPAAGKQSLREPPAGAKTNSDPRTTLNKNENNSNEENDVTDDESADSRSAGSQAGQPKQGHLTRDEVKRYTTSHKTPPGEISRGNGGPLSDSVKSVISGSTRGSIDAQSSSSSTLSGEGRVPTPELRNSPTVKRHHLDITTPSKGGALLVKPQRAHRSPQRSEGHRTRDTSVPRNGAPLLVAEADAAIAKGRAQPKPSKAGSDADLRRLATSPTYGKPTVDTHALLNENASHDEILETRYVHSPYRHRARQQDEDAVSVASSICSTASSSLASEVLERARARRDKFWGRDGQVNHLTR